MTSNNTLSFNAVDGPSKFYMMLSLLEPQRHRTVEFTLEGARAPIVVAITAIQQEDGSGESWNFEGRMTNYRRGFEVRGYFSSKSRKGYITFIIPFHYAMKGDERVKVERPEDQLDMNDYLEWLRGKGTCWPAPNAHTWTTPCRTSEPPAS